MWHKKFPNLAAAMAATPPVAPDAQAQITPDALPGHLPSEAIAPVATQLGGATTPNALDDVKRRVLQNIARGHKGF